MIFHLFRLALLLSALHYRPANVTFVCVTTQQPDGSFLCQCGWR